MAPFRGARGGRGGRNSLGNGRLARSGIRTKSGYRRFDSQRIKEAVGEQSDHDASENSFASQAETSSDADTDDEDDLATKSYNTLIHSLQQSNGYGERQTKRRKIAPVDKSIGVDADLAIEDHVLTESDQDIQTVDNDESSDIDDGEDLNPEEAEFDGSDDPADPYQAHFVDPSIDEIAARIVEAKDREWKIEKLNLPHGRMLHLASLKGTDDSSIPKDSIERIDDLPLNQRLFRSAKETTENFDDIQRSILPYMTRYNDVFIGDRTPQSATSLRTIVCLHAINHILKGRNRVLKNNARLGRAAEAGEELDLRDQGFTRPKVLILLETRQMCAKYAAEIAALFQPEQQENKKRFMDSFEGRIEERDHWPDDFEELFNGNNDNNFLTSLKFTRKTLKFYSAFYASDIIFASPLGLRRILEHEDAKKRDHDFLSSMELVIVDQADAMQMQNWQNVETVFENLNLPLKEAHGCDFSRVRSWYLEGNAKYLRQTIILSAYITPEMNKIYNSSMLNIAGKAKFTLTYDGSIASLTGGLKQTFSRFDCLSPAAEPDARFKYFTSAVLPALLRLPRPADGAQGILIFVPSYYDFLRIRNFFATSSITENISFGSINDYSEVADQRRARSHFISGKHSFLIYTQRAHHFFRLKIRGVKRVVMYGLPDNQLFYDEIVGGYLGTAISEGRVEPEESGVRCLFSKWDGLRLERVVGSRRVKGMLSGGGDTFDFV